MTTQSSFILFVIPQGLSNQEVTVIPVYMLIKHQAPHLDALSTLCTIWRIGIDESRMGS